MATTAQPHRSDWARTAVPSILLASLVTLASVLGGCGSSQSGAASSGDGGPDATGPAEDGSAPDGASTVDATTDSPSPVDAGSEATVPHDASTDGPGPTPDAAPDAPTGPATDFPSTPIVDPSAPANAPMLFGGADAGAATGGPCLTEPEANALYPSNWVRPRFNWVAGNGENLFEIRLHTAAEANDLLVYTAGPTWTMPKAMWTGLAADAAGVPIDVTIRGATLTGGMLTAGPSLGSSQVMTVAPVAASGSIVYWTTTGTSALERFSPGDETVSLALQPSQVQMKTVGGAAVTCFGCHTSTPDGMYAGLTAQGPWGNVLASVGTADAGSLPPFLGAGALTTLQTSSPLGIQTYSKAHWTTGDRVMVTPSGDSPGNQLIWVDLEATTSGQGTSYGTIARTGDTLDVGAPTFSHDGKTIVYVSTNAELTGRLDDGIGRLYSVPYNDRQGGAATPIPGASSASLESYYPAFSPDDAFLAFDQVPSNTQMYNQPKAEMYVIPAAGGTATRLAANDPPACSGKASPGVTNSWPKWGPGATTVAGKTYYWITFSSTRDPMGNPQLYLTGIVVEGGTIQTYGSIYIWNQTATDNNHTPAWDYFL